MARFNPDTELSRELLERLYSIERLTTEEIAENLGCGASTILRALHDYGIPIRTKSDYRMEFSRDELERLYLEEGYSEDEIGRMFNCNGWTIGRRLKELGIPTRPACGVPIRTVPEELLGSWSPNLAYAVGLIATDGNLSKDRSRVEFISTDLELIELYCRALGLDGIHVVSTHYQSRKPWYKVKVSDHLFRMFLDDIGLAPAKSKTIGPLQIPDSVYPDFLRGVFDGDGSWYVSKSSLGRYQYLRAEVCTASLDFAKWIQQRIECLCGLQCNFRSRSLGRYHYLTYIGQKALALGRWMYYSSDVLALTRKRQIWNHMQSKDIARRTE
jgi:DNA-binding CsgD family transcriptional regulator